jgi:uncharacterized membrane protein
MEAAMGKAARRQAERRMNAKAFVIVGAILIALGFVAYRPAVILGVEPGALANSVSDASGGGLGGSSCRDHGDGVWFCSVMDREGSSGTGYRVTTHGFGCWNAVHAGRPLRGMAEESSGCIGFFDALSPL